MEKRKEKTKIEFVIDTNILISALIPKKTKLRDILLSGDFRIYAPEYLLKELDKFYLSRIEEAYTICQEFDEKDTPFIALSLMLEIPLLTNDKGIIENAGLYEVLTIEDLFKMK
jgi:predicted nucleic acid-binding protein